MAPRGRLFGASGGGGVPLFTFRSSACRASGLLIAFSTFFIHLLMLGQDDGKRLVVVQPNPSRPFAGALEVLEVIEGCDRKGHLPKDKRSGFVCRHVLTLPRGLHWRWGRRLATPHEWSLVSPLILRRRRGSQRSAWGLRRLWRVPATSAPLEAQPVAAQKQGIRQTPSGTDTGSPG